MYEDSPWRDARNSDAVTMGDLEKMKTWRAPKAGMLRWRGEGGYREDTEIYVGKVQRIENEEQ